MAQVRLKTSRLLLRGACSEDLDAFHQWFRNPDAMHFWSTAPLSLEKTKSYLNHMVSSPHNGVVDFSVCLLPSDSRDSDAPIVIGKAGMWDGREIGFIFNKTYWGKGYAHEALQAVVDQYWLVNNQEGAEPIKADVDPRNEASLRLLRKLGFEVTGTAERTFETHIGWCDSIYLEAKRPTK